MTVAPKYFSYADTGAPSLTGQVGKLTDIFDECLVLARQFTAVSAGSFVDNSVEARLEGGTAFKLFQGPTAANDEAYFGLRQPFEQIVLKFGTAGVGGTAIYEYWNGSTWTTFAPTDGTASLTADGTISWSIASLTGWVANSVNSVTAYWIRIRFSGTYSTNPLVNSATITGWAVAYSGTNKRIYRMGAGSAGLMFRVQDDGNNYGTGSASSAGALEAQWAGCETASDVDTTTNEFPTAVQISTRLTFRKSNSLDATARTWFILADDRTAIVIIDFGEAVGTTPATRYVVCYMGEIYSVQPGDPWKVMAIGRYTPNSGGFLAQDDNVSNIDAVVLGNFIARAFTGLAGSLAVGKHPAGHLSGGGVLSNGSLNYPNGPDGGVYLGEIWITEPVQKCVRGKLRGWWAWHHAQAAAADLTVISGANQLAGRTFKLHRSLGNGNGMMGFETSNTWPVSS